MAEIILANLTDINGFSTVGVTASGTSYTATVPGIYYVDQSGTFTFTLPNPSSLVLNNFVIVKDRDGMANTNAIVIVASGGATIDGAAQVIIDVNYGAAWLSWNGVGWSRLG